MNPLLVASSILLSLIFIVDTTLAIILAQSMTVFRESMTGFLSSWRSLL